MCFYLFQFQNAAVEVPVSPPPVQSPTVLSPTLGASAMLTPQQSGSSAYPSSMSSYHSSGHGKFQSPDTDDAMSVASSSSIIQKDVTVPDLWRPSIMQCISASTPAEQKKLLTSSVKGEIARDLVTQMHAFKAKPDRAFCTTVAKLLVKKYSFMKDAGRNVSGYES